MVNKVSEKTMHDLHQATMEKTQYLKDCGLHVMEMWECNMKKELEHNEDMKQYFEDYDVNGSCKNFIDAFVSVINKHAPYRKITKQEHKLFHKPWITPAIFTSIKHKQPLYYSHFLKGDVKKNNTIKHMQISLLI